MAVIDGRDAAAVAAAADRLAAGALVAFPTETVYGLGARADQATAVAAIYAAKGRPSDHPLIVHVQGIEQAQLFAAALPPAALRLMQAFWPGPLTVIVPRRPGVAEAAAGGHATVGLRCPSHPVAQALLQAAAARGVAGVAAPSANRFGRVSPTRAAHVVAELGDGLCVLDGGDCALGIESAIVDCSRAQPMLLRPGVLSHAQIQAALGQPLAQLARPGPAAGPADAPAAAVPPAPGLLASHYAPTARLRLLPAAQLPHAVQAWMASRGRAGGADAGLCTADTRRASGAQALAVYSPAAVVAAGVHWQPMPGHPVAVAHELFAVLRTLDDAGVAEIWVQAPPDGPDWDGVRDRLQRAATPEPPAAEDALSDGGP